jgi:predicted CXXCH cytochrome family protein
VPSLEILLLAAMLVLVVGALQRLGFHESRSLLASCAVGAVALALALGVALGPRSSAESTPIRVERAPDYVSSNACRSCHPAEYQSWHRSFHRSMTEPAKDDTVRAAWQGVIGWRGRSYTLSRRGDEFWVKLPDPDREAVLARGGAAWEPPNEVERRVVMTTGSHHYQGYWVQGARGNELWQLPIVYHFESGRFIARHDAFLHPEDDPAYFARWNSNCIQCHSVAGEPRHDSETDRFDSRVVELGVACESCHGPGAAHVARRRSPFARLWQQDGDHDRDIVNPARLDAELASEICGQCHGYFMPKDTDRWWTSGFAERYRPGDDLDASHRMIEHLPGSAARDPEIDAGQDSLFYPDGTIRVGGREWNGLRRSECFTRGQGERKLACTSCHQLHGGSRDDQLSLAGGGNAVCQGCHADHGATHSRHREGSSGSECMSCHMPRTTYALFKGIRSHRITSPRVDRTPGAALNACNLCHQDRSLEWASGALRAWSTESGTDVLPEATPAVPTQTNAPWSALAVAALSGDAAARVVATFELGSAAAREVSGTGWQAQLLVEALDDPYAAIRFVAQRSLRTFAGFEDFAFDFDAPRSLRLSRQADGRRRAQAGARQEPRHAALPLDEQGLIPRAVIEQLIGARDERPIRIAE